MPDLTYNRSAAVRSAAPDAVVGKGEGRNVKVIDAYQNPGALTVGQTIKFMRIDTNARIHRSASKLTTSANAASTTLSLGLASVNNNIASNVPAALMAATTIATAADLTFPTAANSGKMAWELAGLSSDPGGQFDVYGVTGGATLNASSDLLCSLGITID